jgi:pimeloyl-ACP methyl ester carboxylesterase
MITRRAKRWAKWATTITLIVVVVVIAAAGWMQSEQIEHRLLEVSDRQAGYDLQVLAVDEETVTLPLTEQTGAAGVWGLEWIGGYAVVGEVVATTETTVTRELVDRSGVLRKGDNAAIDRFAVESNPADCGVEFRSVYYEGELGFYPAWSTGGTDDTWVVLVHGRGASPREALRVLPAVEEAGFPTLVITYRNDRSAPENPSGRFHNGTEEWADVEAAVRYALEEGAGDVVVFGYGMGGAAAIRLLEESDLAEWVVGLVLDAPLVDAGTVIDDLAARDDVPGFVVGLGKALATLRFGIEWDELDQVDRAAGINVPVLLYQGDADEQIPVRSSDEFAVLLPDLFDYRRVEGAGYGEAWNLDPAAYEAALVTFLDQIAGGPSSLTAYDPNL